MKWRRIVAWGIIVSLVVCGLSTTLEVTGQTVVNQLENVKKPGLGKLYFSKRDSSLNIWKGKWVKVVQETASMAAVPPVVVPPVLDPVLEEIALGYWEVPDRILVAKLLDGKYHLMQTNASRSYYVARGKNLLTDARTKVTGDPDSYREVTGELVSGVSDIGGLATPASFKDGVMTAKGYVKNNQGEWVLGAGQTPIPIVVPPVVDPVADKIKVPVGLIMWDNWTYDYWNDPKPKYDYLINHITRNRYTATVWGQKYNLVPFYGSYHAPEKVKIRTNVKWNQELGRNTYDEIEKWVEVKYDKTAADTEREVRYYREAGFDFLCFNYYNTDSYLSEARQHFVAMQNKLGMKMTLKVQNKRSDAEIANIAELMTKDYWFRINNKAVLYMNSGDFGDLPKYQAALRALGGGEIYVVYYGFDGYPGDWSDYLAKRNDAISAYNTTIGGNATAEQQLLKEVADRESWMGQYKATHVQLIPVLSLGLENLDLRTDLGSGGKPVGVIEAASVEQVNRKFELMRDFIKKYPDKVPAVIWNSANEINESGESFVAKKLRNGTIDTSRLDVAKRWLE